MTPSFSILRKNHFDLHYNKRKGQAMTTTIINGKVIQPKPAMNDNDTDTILSNVFKSLLCQITERHDRLIDLADTLNLPVMDGEKFYSWKLNR
jgi:hypothetical protein